MISKKVLFVSVIVFVVSQSASSPVASSAEEISVDITCIANATCLKGVSNKVVRALKLKKPIDFGMFTVSPLKNAKTEGRSFTKFWDIASSNAINVPLGNYAVNIQKSDEYNNYLEVSVSKAVEGNFKFIEKHRRKTNSRVSRTHRTWASKEANAVLRSLILGCQSSRLVVVGTCWRRSPLHQGFLGLKTRFGLRRNHDFQEGLRTSSWVIFLCDFSKLEVESFNFCQGMRTL